MVEQAAIDKLVAAFETAKATTMTELKAVHDHDISPVQDWDYPCVTVDWDGNSKFQFTGNQVQQDCTIMVSLYVADGHPPDAWRRLRGLLYQFQKTVIGARRGGKTDDGHIFTLIPGTCKPGQKLGTGTYTAAAFLPVVAQHRGPS